MSDCNVCIGGAEFDGQMEMYDVKIVRTRKDHRCVECNRAIPKGTECERISGKWEGEFSTSHTCLDCMNIRDGLSCGDGMVIGELWQEIADCEVFERMTTACIAKVPTASAKAYLIKRWQRWKGLHPQTNADVSESPRDATESQPA